MMGIFLCKSLTSKTFLNSIGTAINTIIINSGGSKLIGHLKRKTPILRVFSILILVPTIWPF
jgi:hypothetical protein